MRIDNNSLKRSVITSLFLSALFLVPALNIAAEQPAPPVAGYHLIKKIQIGGEGGWDYLTMDSAARRLYVSHSKKVVVVDVDKGEIVGEIPDTNGVHGIALATDLGKGFTSNGMDSAVTMFDLKTLKTLGTIKTSKGPDAIIYDPASHRVFTFNAGGKDTTAIDASTGTVAGSIPLGGKPEFAAADGKGMIYVNIEDKAELIAFDARNLTVKAHWSLTPGEDPSGMAMDTASRRLFIGCGNKKMMVVNADTGKIVAELPIGQGVDANGFDPGTRTAFASCGDGTLTVVHEDSADKYSVVENAVTQRGARTMALDTKTHNVYLATAEFGPPPAATAERPHPRPTMIPNTMVILVFGK